MEGPPYDLSAFRWIKSQTSPADRRALLMLRDSICAVLGRYRYAEVGSHLGGSLQPHVIDPRCVGIMSIDPRPTEQPDERWAYHYRYEGNSSQRMLSLLAAIPGSDLTKLAIHESNSWDLPVNTPAEPIDFAFIDGEHTNRAVKKDFKALKGRMSRISVIAFHDCFVTSSALLTIQRRLRLWNRSARFYHFPDSEIVAVAFQHRLQHSALTAAGWVPGLPLSRWEHVIKPIVRKRLHWLVSLKRRFRKATLW